MEKKLKKPEVLCCEDYEVPQIVAIDALHLVFQGAGSFQFDNLTTCAVGDQLEDLSGDCLG